MKRISTLMAIMLIGLMAAKAQPQGFSYQAMLRSPSGEVMANQDVTVKISLRSGALDGKVEYSEVHEAKTSSGGVIAIAVGTGTEPYSDFAKIPWEKGIFIQTEVKPEKSNDFVDMGTTQIMAVPYSLRSETAAFAQTAQTAQEALTATQLSSTNPVIIKAPENLKDGDAIFTVRNSRGDVVFEVYEDGVRANVNNSSSSRSGHGGFVVSNLGSRTDTIMNVSLDGIEFRLADAPGTEGRPQKASFAVGGMAGRGRAEGPNTYLLIEPTGAEINFIEPEQQEQGRPQKASFAVGGMAGRAEAPNTYLSITPDLTQINLKESTGRTQKASFAVGGMAGRAGESDNLLTVSSDSTRIYIGNAESDGSFAVASRSNTGLRAQGRNFLNITPKNANITFGGANTSQENIGSFVVGSYDGTTITPFMTVQKDKATFNSVHSEGNITTAGTVQQQP